MSQPSRGYSERRAVSPSDDRAPISPLSKAVIGDLEALCKSMEALEIQCSILSIQMQYDQSPYAMRTMDLARQLGEIQERLENVVTFGT